MDWSEVEHMLGRLVDAIDAGELDASVALREQLRGARTLARAIAAEAPPEAFN